MSPSDPSGKTPTKPARHPLFAGVTVTSLGTLVSRVLGVLRESAAAGLLGMSKGGIMDAYVIAFRIPNLFRRLFGEGAMTASFMPVLAANLERDRRAAWKLVSVAMTTLAAALALLVLVAEGVCGLMLVVCGEQPGMRLLLGLTAAMLPYTVFICLAAMVSATLQALGEFSLPAIAPAILNLSWLIGAWFIAPRISSDPQTQAYVMAGCVVVSGVVQWLVQVPALRRQGFRFDLDFAASRQAMGQVMRAMVPTTLGLAVLQINTLTDSVLARGLASVPGQYDTLSWLGGVRCPVTQGAASAVWYGERIYQFPLGLLGVAVATVIFPMLSSHAARGDHARVGADLTLGLRLVLFGAVPAAAGLFFMAEPIARLLLQHGEFTPADTARSATMISGYAVGIWAYCAGPVLVRGFYAVGDRITPLRVGMLAVGLNLGLNLVLIWPLGELALAVSTATAATLQVVLLAWAFSRSDYSLEWGPLRGTVVRTLLAAAPMSAVVRGLLQVIPPAEASLKLAAIRVVVPLAAGGAVYWAAFWLMRGPELRMLRGGLPNDSRLSE